MSNGMDKHKSTFHLAFDESSARRGDTDSNDRKVPAGNDQQSSCF